MSDALNIYMDAPPVERKCVSTCKELGVSCPNTSCRSWLDYEEDLNCTHVAVDKHEEGLTLREIGDRLGISFVRVCQIEKSALEKLKKKMKKPVSVK